MNRKNLQLFLTFLKIGAFTFGGGYAMIPLIEKEVTEKRKWISRQDILDVVAIAESTPGPIAINSATFVGFKVAGVLGSFVSTLGVVLPSFLIIIAVSYLLNLFLENEIISHAFWGLRAGILALITKALISMYQQCQKDFFAYMVMIFSFVSVTIFQCNVFIVILACALLGLASYLLTGKAEQG